MRLCVGGRQIGSAGGWRAVSESGSAGNVRGWVVAGGGAGASVIGMIGAGCVEAAANRLLPRRGCQACELRSRGPVVYSLSVIINPSCAADEKKCSHKNITPEDSG